LGPGKASNSCCDWPGENCSPFGIGHEKRHRNAVDYIGKVVPAGFSKQVVPRRQTVRLRSPLPVLPLGGRGILHPRVHELVELVLVSNIEQLQLFGRQILRSRLERVEDARIPRSPD
jgi:hypothetical protein